MRGAIKRLSLGLVALMSVVVANISAEVTQTTLWSFTGGTDGAVPAAGLVQGNDGNFYGTTTLGGSNNNNGTVFRISPHGILINLYSFSGYPVDGANPQASLVQGSDGSLYGMTYLGGIENFGTVFQISLSGILTDLWDFSGFFFDRGWPIDRDGLVQGVDGNFYGTTSYGVGSVFQITSSGTLSTLWTFDGGTSGGIPAGGLIQGSDSNFYGTASSGGASGNGTVFRISSSGSLMVLYTFGGADGAFPQSGLVQGSDGSFYGTTSSGGASNNGTVFRISPSGVLTNLHFFGSFPTDGASPYAGLVQGRDGNFYGTTSSGGASNNGTVFRISPSGVLTNLHSFGGSSDDGTNPYAKLVQGRDGNFYGTTQYGGAYGEGTVFKLDICGLSVSITNATFGQTGGSGSVSVTAQSTNCTWTAASNDGFITITSVTNGSGNGVVGYSVATNTVSNPRIGTMTIAEETFTVIQYGVGCGYLLASTNAAFDSAGGSNSVTVIAPNGCGWAATTGSSFLTITSGSNGNGNGTVGYAVAANTNTLDRIGTVTIAGLTFTVTQAAAPCSFTLGQTSVTNFNWAGGSSNVMVIANGTNCFWTASSLADFLTIAPGSNGTGNGTVGYTVGMNSNTAPRCGYLSIAGQDFYVVQDSGDSVGDEIPNWWRAAYFGGDGTTTNNQSCARCDADGTGQNNLFKYVAGLDPTNPASVFFLQITPIPGIDNMMHLQFGPTFAGHTYMVQYRLDMTADDWSLMKYVFGDSQVVEVDVLRWNYPAMFYRIAITDKIIPQ